ncbi:MAG: serine hydrolase domain-containing protein [Acidimicrobiales bacterium]|nr:serine hydrolase domain-containing protein [Acidimicrobiales bacterium]
MPALDAFETRLQSVLDETCDAHGVPGAVAGVIQGDERLVVASGLANAATGIDATPDTLFQIGSISKIYTATLIMQLVHAGVVELDEPVRGALQEFRVGDDTATLTITPRQLLSHTSGIEGDHFLDCGRNPDALWRYVSTLEDLGQLHAPDDLFSYCNAGYGVLGRLVEDATGDHFTRALHRRVVRPLGLARTVMLAEQAIIHRVAAGHRLGDDGPRVNPWTLARFNVPIGGVIADAGDVLGFARFHLAGGKNAEGKQVVPGRALSRMREAQIEVPGATEEWGLGWNIADWGGTEVFGHDGDTVGQRAFLRVIPDEDAAIVVLTNAPTGDHVADAVFEAVGADVLGCQPPELPPALPLDERPDASACTGIYERMHQRLALASGDDDTLRMTIIPDELFSLAGQRERTLTLEPVGKGRFRTTDPDTGVSSLVVMVNEDGDEDTDETSRPAYVHFGRRAHACI